MNEEPLEHTNEPVSGSQNDVPPSGASGNATEPDAGLMAISQTAGASGIGNDDAEAGSADGEDGEAGDEDSPRRTRLMGGLALACIAAAGGIMLLVNWSGTGSETTAATILTADTAKTRKVVAKKHDPTRCPGIRPSRMVMSRVKILDTIYTTDSAYLDINLARQTVTFHPRNGQPQTFLISSGNPGLSKGMRTPIGFFTVQGKTPLAISHQFNDAKLINWIGVQGGVGFHALNGTGYYWNLGKRPSSHGCIRMSHAEVKRLYSLANPGMPIISHYGYPARVVAFCDADDTVGANLIDSASVYNRALGKERLQALFAGEYWTNPQPRIVHLKGQRLRWGMGNGDSRSIPAQKLPGFDGTLDYSAISHAVAHPDKAYTALYAEKLFDQFRALDVLHNKDKAAADSAMDKPEINE